MGEVVQFQTDGLRSMLSGLGDPSRDKAASGFYAPNFLTDQQLIDAYRASWIARKLVDIPAQDALRKWRNWQADQKQIEQIECQEKRLGLQAKLLQCKTLARLWGGAAIFVGTDQEPHEPFDPKTLKKDGLRYLTVFSRRELVSGELEQDPFSEDYGKPAYYEVAGSALAKIHPSRLVVQIGAPHADQWNVHGPNSGWGDSVLQSSYDAVRNADGTAANIASLVFEATNKASFVTCIEKGLCDNQGTISLCRNMDDPKSIPIELKHTLNQHYRKLETSLLIRGVLIMACSDQELVVLIVPDFSRITALSKNGVTDFTLLRREPEVVEVFRSLIVSSNAFVNNVSTNSDQLLQPITKLRIVSSMPSRSNGTMTRNGKTVWNNILEEELVAHPNLANLLEEFLPVDNSSLKGG